MIRDDAELAAVRTIDLTTRGRRTGRERRVEIWWFHVDGRFVITGTPGPRDWLANIHADPRIVIHVGGEDLPARAIPIADPGFRLKVFQDGATSWYSSQAELDRLVSDAPMVEVVFDDR